MTEGSKCG